MQRQVVFETRRVASPVEWRRIAFAVAGGILYVVMALAVMQLAFFVLAASWQ